MYNIMSTLMCINSFRMPTAYGLINFKQKINKSEPLA